MRWAANNKGSVIIVLTAIILGIFLGLFVYHKERPAEAVIGEPGNLGTIANNAHNLSSGGPGPIKALADDTGTTEICIFCHTPHRAIRDATLLNAPLWNHNLSAQSYIVCAPPGGSGFLLSSPLSSPDGASKMCLSCHDGTVAIGSVASRTGIIGMTGVGAIGNMPSTAHGYMGTDLAAINHHISSIPMNDALIADKLAQCGLITMRVVYPWDGGAPNTVLLRPTAATYSGQPGVTRNAGKYITGYNYGIQCSTCHDPHYWWTNAGAGCANTCNFLVNGACADVKGTGPGCNNINQLCDVCHKLCP